MTKPKAELWVCRKGHVLDRPDGFLGTSKARVCRTCFFEWAAHEFGVRQVEDASTLAAYEMGGLEAAQEAADGKRRR